MTEELSRNDVRDFWRGKGEMTKAVLAAMDAGWTVTTNGGYPRLWCPCTGEAKTYIGLAKSPGRGASSAAKKIRDKVAGCPEKHKKATGQ